MFNQPTEQQLKKIPKLYETECTPPKEKTIHLHFQFAKSHWFIVEFDGEDTFFGFVILNGDPDMAEWGYISYTDLKEININGWEILNDPTWKTQKASEVELICQAQKWERHF